MQSRDTNIASTQTVVDAVLSVFPDTLILHSLGNHESFPANLSVPIHKLKYFFSSHVATESGGECSSTAIRALIKKLVAAETPSKPLSDSKLTTLLGDQGINVARRTVAKYREQLGLPVARLRKEL